MIQITNPKRFASLIAIAVLVILLVFKLAWGSSTILKTGDIALASGTSAKLFWKTLAREEYTARTLPWTYWSWRKEAAGKLQAGTYHLEVGETVAAVVDRFINGETTTDELTITYPEGFTLKQIAARTAARGLSTEKEFTAAAKAGAFASTFSFLHDLDSNRSLEGYLFPDTYKVFADDTPTDVIKRMLANFDKRVTPEIRAEIQKSGRSLDDIIIMASIIEREVIAEDDMAKIADILWKRNDEGAGLYADATVRYALDKWDGALTVQDLAIDSPYNTRKYRGLPPGAIGNPGLKAILAALRPESTDFYYYLSAPDGTTIFAKTNDEHNRNKAKYLQ